MEIYYYGANSIQVISKEFNILIDPFLYGKNLPKSLFKHRSIVLMTQEWSSEEISDESFIINSPGEYEIMGVTIKGIATQLYVDKDNNSLKRGVAYKVIAKDSNFGFFGHISSHLDENILEEFGLLDFVTIPIGGNGYTLDTLAASSIIKEIDPKIVLPTHFKDSVTQYPVAQDSVDEFGNSLSVPLEFEDNLKIKGIATDSGLRVVAIHPQT